MRVMQLEVWDPCCKSPSSVQYLITKTCNGFRPSKNRYFDIFFWAVYQLLFIKSYLKLVCVWTKDVLPCCVVAITLHFPKHSKTKSRPMFTVYQTRKLIARSIAFCAAQPERDRIKRFFRLQHCPDLLEFHFLYSIARVPTSTRFQVRHLTKCKPE